MNKMETWVGEEEKLDQQVFGTEPQSLSDLKSQKENSHQNRCHTRTWKLAKLCLLILLIIYLILSLILMAMLSTKKS